MFHAGVGDQLLRERLTTLEAKLNDPQVPSPRRKVLQNDVYDVQVQLGHSGLSVSDPVIVVEREYKKAAEARAGARQGSAAAREHMGLDMAALSFWEVTAGGQLSYPGDPAHPRRSDGQAELAARSPGKNGGEKWGKMVTLYANASKQRRVRRNFRQGENGDAQPGQEKGARNLFEPKKVPATFLPPFLAPTLGTGKKLLAPFSLFFSFLFMISGAAIFPIASASASRPIFPAPPVQ